MLSESSHQQRSIAFTEVYNRYSNKIYLYCRKIFGDGTFAEDIFQETFLQFLKNIENKKEISNIPGLLLKIARHLSINHKKSNKNNFSELEDIHAIFHDYSMESKELSQMIDMAMDLLPEEHKEAFILQIFEGLSYNDIAEITNVPLSTVRNRIVRAKSKLREILTPMLELTR